VFNRPPDGAAQARAETREHIALQRVQLDPARENSHGGRWRQYQQGFEAEFEHSKILMIGSEIFRFWNQKRPTIL
jgi:hypothetical protein